MHEKFVEIQDLDKNKPLKKLNKKSNPNRMLRYTKVAIYSKVSIFK